ncbi:MAG TPA: DUF559 domain-containing protein [Candidatus Acidoferrales bacterium]|nr:DUF559 domain-containing protein [Candidatus Acidoferrales bacterium]
MSASALGVPKKHLRGRRLTEAHRKAISEACRGKVFSEERKRNISWALKGLPHPPRSESTKSKIRETMKSSLVGHSNLCKARRESQGGIHGLFRSILEPLGYFSEFMIGPYAFDFADPVSRFVIEVDGPEHRQPLQIKRDAERDAYAVSGGWRVIRVRDWFAKKSPKLVEKGIL